MKAPKKYGPRLQRSSGSRLRWYLGITLVLTLCALVATGILRGRTQSANATQPPPILAPTRLTIHASIDSTSLSTLKSLLATVDKLQEAEWSSSQTADLVINTDLTGADLTLTATPQPNRQFTTDGYVLRSDHNIALHAASEAGRRVIPELKATLAQQFIISDPKSDWTYLALGDIIPARDAYTVAKRSGYSFPFAKVTNRTASADLTVANLETTVANGQSYGEGPGMMRFTAPAITLDAIKSAGIDGVSLANNHAMNGGGEKTAEMLRELDTRQIGHFGVDRSTGTGTWTTTVKGITIAHLSFDTVPGNIEPTAALPGANRISLKPWGKLDQTGIDRVQGAVRTAKESADVVIPWFHWGTEYTHDANDEQRRLAQAAIDAGADVVIATHPHWTQGIEWYKNHLIAYSLGNFIFDQNWSEETKHSVALALTFSGKQVMAAKLEPIVIENLVQPRILAPSEPLYHTILQDIASHSWLP